MAGSELLTIKQVAKLLACHPMTVRRRMDAGEFGEIIREGRRFVRIRREGVEAFISKHTEEVLK